NHTHPPGFPSNQGKPSNQGNIPHQMVPYQSSPQNSQIVLANQLDNFKKTTEGTCGVCILELKDGTVIYMLVERKYPLSKELLQQMLDLGLEVEEESTTALELGFQLTLLYSKELASPRSSSSWFSIHLVVYNEELAILEQMATIKGISNPLMAGNLPKTTKLT
ncbi:hypothetical protein Tco_0494061, partial [Tanacetum coccineum]